MTQQGAATGSAAREGSLPDALLTKVKNLPCYDYCLPVSQRFELAEALQLPTMTAEGQDLLRRLILIAQERRVVATFYPVFPLDEAPNQVLA